MVDELPAKRIRDSYKGENLYVVLSRKDGELYDIQCSISGEKINYDQDALSNIDTIAMLTSLCCREFDLEYLYGRLCETARGPNTLASILANAIMEHGK